MDKLKELGQKIEASLKSQKTLRDTGFKEKQDLDAYLKESETISEKISEFLANLSDVAEGNDAELRAMKATIEQMVKVSKAAGTPDKELSQREILHGIGKTVRVIKGQVSLDMIQELRLRPQAAKSAIEEWTNKKGLDWSNLEALKAQVGSPLTGSPDTGQYVINPIYMTELLRDAREHSDIMGLVRTIPMANREMYFPQLLSNNFVGAWHTPAGNPTYTEGGKPVFGDRIKLEAYTYAGYIPWIDEFEDDYDADVALGTLFMEAYATAYGEEFDRQCLTANADPFTGVLYESNALEAYLPFSLSSGDIPFDWFDKVALKVPRVERANCKWIVNETFLEVASRVRNANGDPLYRQNGDNRPAKLGLYPVIEAHMMPQVGDVKAGDPFAWFGDPAKRIFHGERAGLEVRYFTDTLPGMQHGEIFVRFRKRDAFKVVQQHNSVVVKKGA